MSLAIVIDMNLSPDWVAVLQAAGWGGRPPGHGIGDPRADDRTIMDLVLANQHIVFAHDLDFGTMLALTHAAGPSVLQFRGPDVLPDTVGSIVIAALRQLRPN